MNKTKIEWTDYSWNPITGCLHNCWYCYAKKLFTRFHKSFEPTFYPQRLSEPSRLNNRKPVKIFCCSVSDIFADWTKENWRHQVLEAIKDYAKSNPTLIFQLLTKQPQNIDKDYNFGRNIWVGATVSEMTECKNIKEIKKVKCEIRFISFEPLLEEIIFVNDELEDIDWIIIGKLTGSRKVKLRELWVENILEKAREKKIPIFIKDNVKWSKKIQEFPKQKLGVSNG